MSDAKVLEALEQMETWLSDPELPFESIDLAAWNEAYCSAVAKAERGPGWENLVARAHLLGDQLKTRMAGMVIERDALKLELGSFAQGDRALKGYGAHSR